MTGRTVAWTLAGLALALPALARAQAVPPPGAANAGQADPSSVGAGLIERGAELAAPHIGSDREATIDDRSAAPPSAAAAAGQVSFRLTAVRFAATRFLTPAELDAEAAPLLGTTVTFADLARLLDRVNARFVAKGAVTARAILPPQEIEGGVVRVDIVEGRVGAQTVTSPGYTPTDYVASRVTLPPGAVDIRELRRRISGFNRTNDAQLRAELRAGASTGLTDVQVAVTDVSRTGAQLFVDNNAYNSTGRNEIGVSLRRNQLVDPGDRATLFASASRGAVTAVLGYSAALGDLTRISLGYAHSDIEVVDGQFAALGIKGRSDTIVASVSRPIVIGETSGVAAQGAYTLTRSVNEVAGETVGDVVVAKGGVGLNGFTSGRLGLLRVDVSAAYAGVDTRVGQRTGGFLQAIGSMDYTSAALPLGFVARAAVSGQYADRRDVPGSQVYQLGGVSSVRGYEPGAVSGYAGYLGSFELHRGFRLPGDRSIDAYMFTDAGEVFAVSGDRSVTGAGVGINATLTRRLLFQGVYAHGFKPVEPGSSDDRVELRLAYTFS